MLEEPMAAAAISDETFAAPEPVIYRGRCERPATGQGSPDLWHDRAPTYGS